MAAPKFNLTEYDAEIVGTIFMNIDGKPIKNFPEGGSLIKFQFPAKITKDSKKNRWNPLFNTFEYEPAYLYKGGDTRKLTINTTYIVGGPTHADGTKWDAGRVALELRRWKSYFYIGGPTEAVLPIWAVKLYEHIGNEDAATFRGTSVDIKHGTELIKGSDGKTFPLRSDVSLNLELVTNIEFSNEGKKPRFTYGQGMELFKKEWY
jgi:hypothetical protein